MDRARSYTKLLPSVQDTTDRGLGSPPHDRRKPKPPPTQPNQHDGQPPDDRPPLASVVLLLDGDGPLVVHRYEEGEAGDPGLRRGQRRVADRLDRLGPA